MNPDHTYFPVFPNPLSQKKKEEERRRRKKRRKRRTGKRRDQFVVLTEV